MGKGHAFVGEQPAFHIEQETGAVLVEAAQPAGDTAIKADYSSETYDQHFDDESSSKGPQTYFPDADKKMHTLSAEGSPDTTALDKNRCSIKDLKHKHSIAHSVAYHKLNTRNGTNRILGTNDHLLRPGHEFYRNAVMRACARRKRREAKGLDDDDDCVQFNESSAMYDSCDIV